MDERTQAAFMEDLGRLERRKTEFRLGIVSQVSPLQVKLGGSSTALTVKTVLNVSVPLSVNDVVAVLQWGGDCIVIGSIKSVITSGEATTARTSLGAAASAMEAPIDASLATNWTTIASVEEPRYFKDGFGIVHIEGTCTRTTSGFTFSGSGATLFTLPSGYRPEKLRVFICRMYDGTAYYAGIIIVNTDGTVVVGDPASPRNAVAHAQPTASVGSQVFLDGITFRPSGV